MVFQITMVFLTEYTQIKSDKQYILKGNLTSFVIFPLTQAFCERQTVFSLLASIFRYLSSYQIQNFANAVENILLGD